MNPILNDFFSRYPFEFTRTRVPVNPYWPGYNPYDRHWCMTYTSDHGAFVTFYSTDKRGTFPDPYHVIESVGHNALAVEQNPTLPGFLAEYGFTCDQISIENGMFRHWVADNLVRPGLRKLFGDSGYNELMEILSQI